MGLLNRDQAADAYARTLKAEDLHQRDRLAATSWRWFVGDVGDAPGDGAEWRSFDTDNPEGD